MSRYEFLLKTRRMEDPAGWVILPGGYGLGFSLLCAIPHVFIGGPGYAVGYFIGGFPFDLTHGLASAALAAILLHPLERLMRLFS